LLQGNEIVIRGEELLVRLFERNGIVAGMDSPY